MQPAKTFTPSTAESPRLEVADILRLHGEAYRAKHDPSLLQRRVMRSVEVCRTAALGGHLDICDSCAFRIPSYNSCRDRHCPKCQGIAQARWIERRKERILPTHYFHVVFTLPQELRPLAIRNRKRFFDLLFRAASATLLQLGRDPARLGAELGLTAVLHTWSRDLSFHPHLHCIVTGGGLSPEGDRWIAARRNYVFPVRVLSRLFRGKFLDGISRLYAKGELDLDGQCANLKDQRAFAALKDVLYKKNWVVYAKRPFGGAEQVFQYLGRYTHRVGLSNHRLMAMDRSGVRFATREGKSVTLEPHEFIRRFLLHVLPPGFVKVRHYGLMAGGNVKTKLQTARRMLEGASKPNPLTSDDTLSSAVPVLDVLIDRTRCPRCLTGTMLRHPLGTGAAPLAGLHRDSS